MKVAVFKPDHFGDLVLSSAAIRVALRSFEDTTVFVAPANLGLARFLFGEQRKLRPIAFPHLQKRAAAAQDPIDFSAFDLCLFLRRDGVINPAWAEIRCKDFLFPVDSHDDHQSILDFAVVAQAAGRYNIEEHHFAAEFRSVEAKADRVPERIGFSIGSGFNANVWPAVRWIELGRRLQAQRQSVALFGGPRENVIARMIAGALHLAPDDVIIGGGDVEGFARRAREIDWFVASDGGTAHLCGAFAPVTSIFGPSPFRRYAPFGRWNRLLTKELACSPCCQWAAKLVNGCLSAECMADVSADTVIQALGPPYASNKLPSVAEVGGGVRLHYGISHANVARKLDERAKT